MAKTPQNDFDAGTLTKTQEDHGKSITDIKNRLNKLENRFGDNEKTALTLKSVFESQTKAQDALATTFVKLLNSDKVIESATWLVNRINGNKLKFLASKIGFAVWSAVLFICGVVVTVIITNILQK